MGTESHGAASERATIRRVVGLGALVETAMIALDVYTSAVVFPTAHMAKMVGLRCVAVLVCIAAYLAASRLASLGAARRVAFAAFVTVAVLIVLQAREQGGLQSRYLHGVWVVGLYYVTSFPMPWRVAVARGFAIVATFPVVLAAAALVDAGLAAQWANRNVLAVFVEEYFFVLVTVVLAAIASHTTWSTRRKLVAEERKQTLLHERSEMAMELHDGVSAALQRALMLLESDESSSGRVVRESIEDGIREARAMTSLLVVAPSTWHEVVALARREIEDACDRAGIVVTFEGSDDPLPVPPALAHDVCRIVREAATNVVRHSRARAVRCVLFLDGDVVRIAIEDDGCGMPDVAAGAGRGLSILARRAKRHGGDLTLSKRAGGGLSLRASLRLGQLAGRERSR